MISLFKKDERQVVHVNDMDALIGKVNIIDIREIYEFRTGSLKTANNIPMGELLAAPEKFLNKNDTYYIMCQSGMRSGNTTKILTKQGYQVVNVAGGMGSYVGVKRS